MRVRGIWLAGVLLLAAVPGCAGTREARARPVVEAGQSGDGTSRMFGSAWSGWRALVKPAPDPAERIDRALETYLSTRPGRVAVVVHDRTAETRYAFGEGAGFMLASVAKVDILLALLLKTQRAGRELTPYERTLTARMIRYSDNDCARELYLTIGGPRALGRMLRRHGVRHTRPGLSLGMTMSRPSDQVAVLERLTDPAGPVSAANRRYALELMSSVTPGQAWGVSAAGKRAALKNGWLPAEAHHGRWTVNSVGRVTARGHELLVAVLSERSPTMAAGVATVERVARLTVRALTGKPDGEQP